MVVMMQGYGTGSTTQRADGLGKTTYGGAIMTAKDQACASNLQQVRQGLEAAKLSNGDSNPSDIKDAGIGDSFYVCPVGGEPYVYDPSTGQVHCPHPGHEKF
jgi:hypothetical protein